MPWVLVEDAAGGAALVVHPGGHVAGAVVQADLEHGVWKAPANLPILGIVGLERQIDDQQQGPLIARGVNVLRSFPGRGNLIWGARTTSQDTEWKYINLRRYFIYLEQSIDQGLQWVVFEPNGEALWSQVQQSVANFLFNEHRSGALQGSSPTQAYFVRCDTSTMTQDDIDNGRLICLVGVAPVHPAEFIIFQIGKLTGPGASPCT
jgi:phage tail sheath protein FI